jgi:hypothetical protein
MERTLLILIGFALICVGFLSSSWALQLSLGYVGGAVIASVFEEVE